MPFVAVNVQAVQPCFSISFGRIEPLEILSWRGPLTVQVRAYGIRPQVTRALPSDSWPDAVAHRRI